MSTLHECLSTSLLTVNITASVCNEDLIYFYYPNLVTVFLFYLLKFLFICNFFKNNQTAYFLWSQFFQEQMDNHYVNYAILLDTQDQLLIQNYLDYLCKSNLNQVLQLHLVLSTKTCLLEDIESMPIHTNYLHQDTWYT